MPIYLKFTPYVYQDDMLQILVEPVKNKFQLINVELNPENYELIKNTKEWFLNQFKIELKTTQMHLISPKEKNKNELILPITIFLTELQADEIKESKQTKYQFTENETIDLKNLIDKDINQQTRKFIIEQFDLHSLFGIKELLTSPLTTDSLTACLKKLTYRNLKRNNVGRDFKNELAFIEYDHSRPGRPKAIYELKPHFK